MIAPRSRSRAGFSVVELVVALTVLSVGLLALAGTAVVAQRSFATADATERAARAAAAVIDSLLRVREPVGGSRDVYGTAVTWSVAGDSERLRLFTEVRVHDGATPHRFTFESQRLAAPPGSP
jgi:prepilin-type N-terminal cleavage/methylation domain-containing protein